MLRWISDSLSRFVRWLQEGSETHYYVRNHAPPSLFTFVEPDESSLEKIRGILERMPIAKDQGTTNGDGPPHLSGDVGTILEQLRLILSTDIIEMRRFTTEELAVAFHYEVQEDWRDPDGIRVLTRMHRPGRKGSISYGPLVRRIAADQYCLWRS